MADGEFEISGTRVSLEGARAVDAESEDEPWWGHIEITQGKLELGSPSEFEGQMTFDLRDTKPLLRVFALKEDEEGKRRLPLSLRLVPNIRNVKGVASVAVEDEAILIDDVAITGEGLVVRARMSIADQVDGDLYVRFKGVGLGVELKNGKKDFKIRRPLQWFESRPSLSPSSGPE